jgi:hypothetical protein
MTDQANDPNYSDSVRVTLLLPRPLFDGLLELGKRYKTGVRGVIRHLAHNAVDKMKCSKP